MMSQENNNLQNEFNKAFNYVKKQYEAELKQNPFYFVAYKNRQGEIHHAVRMCNN